MIVLVDEFPWKVNPMLLVTLAYHVVPDGRPVSVNVTLYVTFEKVTEGKFTAVPETVNVPAYEDGSYILSLIEFKKL